MCPRRGEGCENEETIIIGILPQGVNRGGQSAVQVRNGADVYRVAHYMQETEDITTITVAEP